MCGGGVDQASLVSDDRSFLPKLKTAKNWPGKAGVKCLLAHDIEGKIEELKTSG